MTDAVPQPPKSGRERHPTRPVSRSEKPIPNEPEDIEHREDAERVKAELAAVGVYPMSPGVYPTVDRNGFVRLTFAEVRKLIALSKS